MVYASGVTYEGEWKDDNRHGIGTQDDMRGNVFYGNWVDDKKDGRWVSYNKTGEKVSEVIYAAGELINN